MANRIKTDRATWRKGVTTKALYQNDGIRVPVVSIFDETPRSMAFACRTARANESQKPGGNNV